MENIPNHGIRLSYTCPLSRHFAISADGWGPGQLALKQGLSEVRAAGTQHLRAWYVR
jgi:hypothetical protein